jgi:hypothetical protein
MTCPRLLMLATTRHVCIYLTSMRFILLPLTRDIVSTWMFRFSNEVVSEIVARTLSATSPRYHTIKELDRKLRGFLLPPQTLDLIRGGPNVDPRSLPLSASMLTYMLGSIGDISKSMDVVSNPTAAGAKQKRLSALIPPSQPLCPSPHRRPR